MDEGKEVGEVLVDRLKEFAEILERPTVTLFSSTLLVSTHENGKTSIRRVRGGQT